MQNLISRLLINLSERRFGARIEGFAIPPNSNLSGFRYGIRVYPV